MGATGRITLRDVAREVGLSTSAVSMALQDHPRISTAAKRRVQLAADQLGYVANSAGRALRVRRAGAIALIVPNTSRHVFGHAYFTHVLTGVTDVANANDLQVVISTNPDEQQGKVAYERVMRSGTVDGAIVTSASIHDENIDRLVRTGLPVVLLGRFPSLPTAISVGIEERSAGRMAAEHLIVEHGRKTLVHISGPLDHQTALERRDGFMESCAAHGVRGTVIEGDFSEESGVAAGAEVLTLLRAGGGVDGLVAANDEMAFGVMSTLLRAGVDIPTQISVIGFDDFGLSRVTTPSITTVHVPAERMARLATQRLLDIVGGTSLAPRDAHAILPVELVLRESCGCGIPTGAGRLSRSQLNHMHKGEH
ncbi:LacI family DNA-binding transcriptional regulator [Cryobacterium sp. TMT2-4]|uniref:LacI family DNA-binding transcriptional regulator n=1 Tax=Cryobacterium sp. TMT2-4 TaxID=1259254 RepID=UPI00106D4FD8|nr:LacI family DNA-binding transcriptional regulator [Cryobacterium sp. TMT2-4]TFC65127.1 LacI family transcriptional regulator [Cryobacterium sp. TMT2-4]